jgi:serine protease AprX
LTRPVPALRHSASPRRGAVGALLGVAAAAGLVAVPTLPVLQAVVSYHAAPRPVPGVHVVASLPALRMAVVRGDALALSRLVASGQVRGLSPDDTVQLTSGDEDGTGPSVLASAGLGGAAGRAGAGAGVRVAVVDTGVSDTPALNRASGRLIDAVDTSTGVARTGGVYTDSYGHGTFMADLVAGGPVAGTDGAALGVAPAATVLVVRVAGADGSTSLSQVLGGLEWIATHASSVDVANLALSHRRPFAQYGPDPLTDAVEQVRAAGVSMVVSAGNHPGQVGDPGFDPRVLTVGALDARTGRVAAFSGSATVAGVRKPDVVASGVRVLGLLPRDSVLANEPGTLHLADGLFRGTGTSQATAITSGLAAILLGSHPEATPVQVKAALRCAAEDLHGRRDGAGSVRATTELCDTSEGSDAPGEDGTAAAAGEDGFDASSWAASSWAASSWADEEWDASSWAASSWAASSWAASSWAASSWAASSWAASSWAASSWAAGDWGGGWAGGDES